MFPLESWHRYGESTVAIETKDWVIHHRWKKIAAAFNRNIDVAQGSDCTIDKVPLQILLNRRIDTTSDIEIHLSQGSIELSMTIKSDLSDRDALAFKISFSHYVSVQFPAFGRKLRA